MGWIKIRGWCRSEKWKKELGGSENSIGASDEIEMLTLLIEKWDAEHSTFDGVAPIELLHSLMQDHNLKAKDLVGILGISKGLVWDILNCKKGLSKDIIRTLSGYFKVSQEAFNRPYKLKNPANSLAGCECDEFA